MSTREKWKIDKKQIECRKDNKLPYNEKFLKKITRMLEGKPNLIRGREYKKHFNRFIMPKEKRIFISLRKFLWELSKLSN